MPDPTIRLSDIPQFEFHREGIFFNPLSCNHGSVQESTTEALNAGLAVNGLDEDHLLPPYAIFQETFSSDLLLAEREAQSQTSLVAANPKYEGPSYEEVRSTSEATHGSLQRELIALRHDPRAYMKRVREIGNAIYRVPSNTVLPSNYKMAKGVKHGWRTEGIMLAPNVVAGLGDVCPFSSPLCTSMCLNLSGHAEMTGMEGDVMNSRRRKTLMFMHVREAFMARVAGLIEKRSSENPGSYAVRLNVFSDLLWERMKFYHPSTRESTTFMRIFPDVVFYDYTKNCRRYLDWILGKLPPNYYLMFSLSEINALFAIYALLHGGSVTVVFDALPEHIGGDAHVHCPAEPLPKSFCGFPVIDGDESDLRFEDRKRFGIPDGQGFVVGLRLKGVKHRRDYKRDKPAAAGFIFDAKGAYDQDYAETLIVESERRRLMALRAREHRDLPGAYKDRFVGIPETLVSEAKRALGLGRLR